MTSKTGAITVWGTGEEARDLIHVDDLVRFVELSVDRQVAPYEMMHVSAGSSIQIKDLVAKIIAASGRQLRIEHDLAGPTIKTSFALDHSRATEKLGWRPQVSLDEGIRRTVQWWKQAFGA
jgi:nucleoside-diphosphate-sugar epimerase